MGKATPRNVDPRLLRILNEIITDYASELVAGAGDDGFASGNDLAVDMGLYVEHRLFGKPVPVVMVAWQDWKFTETQFDLMRAHLKPKPVKKYGWHKWQAGKYKMRPNLTTGIEVHIGYRDSEADDAVTCGLKVRGFPGDGTMIYDCRITNAVDVWFPWKVAFQRCGYYLVVPCEFIPASFKSGKGDWVMHWTDAPVFLCDRIEWQEIGPWERLHKTTEQFADDMLIPEEYQKVIDEKQAQRCIDHMQRAYRTGDNTPNMWAAAIMKDLPADVQESIMQRFQAWVKEQG